MAWTFVDSDSNKEDASSTTVAAPGITVAAGDLTCVFVGWENGNTTCAVSDGTSSLTPWQTGVVAGTNVRFAMFYILSSVATGTNSVVYTATLGAARTFRNICVMAMRPPGRAYLDGNSAGTTGVGTTPASGNITTTGTDGCAFGCYTELGSSLNTPTINSVSPANTVTPLRSTLWQSAYSAGFTGQATGSISSNDWGMGVLCFNSSSSVPSAALVGRISLGTGGAPTLTTSGGKVATGDALVIIASYDSGATPSNIRDSASNSYTEIGTVKTESGSSLRMWRCNNATGGNNVTASIDFSSNPAGTVYLVKLMGVATAAYDQFADGNDAASPYTLTSPTLSQASEVVLAAIMANTGGSGFLIDYKSSNFTLLDRERDWAAYWTSAISFTIVNATTAVTPSWTASPSTNSALKLATFKGGTGVTLTGSLGNFDAEMRLLGWF